MNDDRYDDQPLDPETSELLAGEEPSVSFPRDAIRERIRASVARREAAPPTPRRMLWLRVGAAIAASLLIFVAGAEYGRRFVPMEATVGSNPSGAIGGDAVVAAEPSFAISVPLAIQTNGSRYIADMARMAETIEQMTPEERQQAREVALAVLYGAAAEILRAGPDDDAAASAARMLLAQKQIANDGSLQVR